MTITSKSVAIMFKLSTSNLITDPVFDLGVGKLLVVGIYLSHGELDLYFHERPVVGRTYCYSDVTNC